MSSGLDLKPWYTLGELAEASGLSRRCALRILRDNHVRLTPLRPTRGKKVWVSHNAIVQAFPDFLETIAGFEAARKRGSPRW